MKLNLSRPLLPVTTDVDSLETATVTARAFIKDNGLGASDLGEGFGSVTTDAGKLVARVSYNGRVFDPKGIEIILDVD